MKKAFFLFLWFAFLLTGCNKEKQVHNSRPEEGVYLIYEVEENKLVSREYQTDTTDTELLVQELLGQLHLTSPQEDNAILVESGSINSQVAYLSFNRQYFSLGNFEEVLFRASVVKTIAQAPGITYVYFYVDGASLNYADGTPVGKMAAADFVDETDDDLNALAWTTLRLYFSNVTGDKLVQKDIEAAYSKTMSIERLVVEQLIAGPDKTDADMKGTLPSNLRVIGVSVKDGVCYVNLDSAFTSEIVDVAAAVQVYSIVNSLTELPNISEVQIQVNGVSDGSLREMSLEKAFGRNQEIIEVKGEN